MKILFVADAASIHTKKWVEFFRDRGDEVHVASFRRATIAGVTVHVMPTLGLGKLGYFYAIKSLPKIHAQVSPDLVHAHYLTSYGFFSALVGLHPLVVTAWGSDLLLAPQQSRFLRFCVSYAIRHADAVTLLAEHMRPAAEALGAEVTRLSATPFGVDTDLFRPSLKATEEKPLVRLISTRSFDAIYDVGTLIHSLSMIIESGSHLAVDLVGDGPMRSKLERLVDDLGLAKYVCFHGHVNPDVLRGLLSRADIYVTSALSDGGSVSLAEAMSCECFPIATRIPANSQWIKHEENGYLYAPGDARELARMIRMAMDHETFRRSAQISNRALAVTELDWRICAERMEHAYRFAVGG